MSARLVESPDKTCGFRINGSIECKIKCNNYLLKVACYEVKEENIFDLDFLTSFYKNEIKWSHISHKFLSNVEEFRVQVKAATPFNVDHRGIRTAVQ